MSGITIKGMPIGSGVPKTIVSVMGEHTEDLVDQITRGIAAGAHCFEYRADFARDPLDFQGIAATARDLHAASETHPLIFTFRSESQGGRATLDKADYIALNEAAIESGAIDVIDIESWIGDDDVARLCGLAHAAGVATIVSFHDFTGTPPADEMALMLVRFGELGADIPKIAVMAHTPHDALALLSATERVNSSGMTGPLLTMAMGPAGSITRLVGETFGSALTFCALDAPSAPGQVGVVQARDIMEQLHRIAAGQEQN